MITIEKNCATINGVKYKIADFITFDLIKMISEEMDEHHISASVEEIADSLSEALEEIQEEMEICY